MQQYFAINKELELEKGDYHHIKNVMRMRKGDKIKVVYDDIIYDCVLTSISDKSSFKVVSSSKKNNDNIKIDLAFSLIKEQKLNYLLQKSTELGINKLIPLNTKRTIIKIDKKSEPSKNIRWKKICKEASEQSFRTDLPVLEEILSLKDLAFKEYDLKLLCSLNKNTKNIKKVLQKNNKCVKILIVVGPEGGFDPKEEEYLVNNGFISVSLGNTVLRAETAPVVAISMINYEFMR